MVAEEGEDVGGVGQGLGAVYAVAGHEDVGSIGGLEVFAFEALPEHGGRGVER